MSDKNTKTPGHYLKNTEKNSILFLNTLIQSQTLNVYKQKDHVNKVLNYDKTNDSDNPKELSHYKRLLRFIDNHSTSNLWQDNLKKGLLLLKEKDSILYLDATKWEIGEFPLHILVLGVRYHGVCVPIYYEVYEHEGVLGQEERIEFMKKALEFVDFKGKTLLCDREFIGVEWFDFLKKSDINFIIRLRFKAYYTHFSSKDLYFKHIEKAKKKGFSSCIITIEGQKFCVEFWKNKNLTFEKNEDVIILITNILNKRKVGRKYHFRWELEYCFRHLKSNGFNLQDLSITDVLKIRLIISFLILAYIFCILEGVIKTGKEIHNGKKVTKTYLINNEKVKYLAVSLFRVGLEKIIFYSRNIKYFSEFLKKLKLII